MSLITNATSTLERLIKLRTASDGAEEAKALDSLQVQLAELASPIKALAAKGSLLRDEGVTFSPNPDLASTREVVQKAFMLFQQTPRATTLRQGTRWTNLITKLQTLAQKTQATFNADWQNYFDQHFFGGLRPEKRGATLAKTPENERVLKKYGDHYQSFIRYRLQPPTSTEEFNKLRELSQQLAEIIFQEDVPEDVRKFLDAVSSGAGLHLLTSEVLAWLRDNGSLDNYVVRARIN